MYCNFGTSGITVEVAQSLSAFFFVLGEVVKTEANGELKLPLPVCQGCWTDTGNYTSKALR